MRILSHSLWRKAVALVIAVTAFVFLYETRILDSQVEALQGIFSVGDQPLPGRRLNFAATAYCKGATTASGVSARTGVAAADPALLPVGSVVNVATGSQKYNGVYTVMDTGPEVQGRELDLYMWNCNEALRFGRKGVLITVLRLGWDPQASAPSLIDRLFRRREAARRVPAPDPPPASGLPPVEATPDSTAPAGDSGASPRQKDNADHAPEKATEASIGAPLP